MMWLLTVLHSHFLHIPPLIAHRTIFFFFHSSPTALIHCAFNRPTHHRPLICPPSCCPPSLVIVIVTVNLRSLFIHSSFCQQYATSLFTRSDASGHFSCRMNRIVYYLAIALVLGLMAAQPAHVRAEVLSRQASTSRNQVSNAGSQVPRQGMC